MSQRLDQGAQDYHSIQDLTVAPGLPIPSLSTTVWDTASCNSRFLLPDTPRRWCQWLLCPWPPALEMVRGWHGTSSSPSLLRAIFFSFPLLHMLICIPKAGLGSLDKGGSRWSHVLLRHITNSNTTRELVQPLLHPTVCNTPEGAGGKCSGPQLPI